MLKKNLNIIKPTVVVRGFALLEASIFLFFVSCGIIASIQLYQFESERILNKIIADEYKMISTAVDTYMVHNYSKLVPLPSDCKDNRPTYISQCFIILNSTDSAGNEIEKGIINGLRPTVVELVDLGFIPKGFINKVRIPVLTNWNASYLSENDPNRLESQELNANHAIDPNTYGTTIEYPDIYAIRIEHICIFGINSGSITNDTCGTNLVNLQSVVYNIAPYGIDTDNPMSHTAKLSSIANLMGGEGFLSSWPTIRGGPAKLKSISFAEIDNPVVDRNNFEVGGILAMRSGYSASSWMNQVRRDGTTAMTGNMNLGGFSILNADSLNLNGKLTAGQVQTNKLSLPVRAEIGSVCNNTTESIAVNLDGTFILNCNNENKWASASPGYNISDYYVMTNNDNGMLRNTNFLCSEYHQPSLTMSVHIPEGFQFWSKCLSTKTWWIYYFREGVPANTVIAVFSGSRILTAPTYRRPAYWVFDSILGGAVPCDMCPRFINDGNNYY